MCLDKMRMDLLMNPHFDFIHAFSLFDQDYSGTFTSTRFDQVLKNQFGLMQTQRELMLVLDHITKGSSSVVTFADFCEAITPRYPN